MVIKFERYYIYIVIAVGTYLVFRALFTTAILLMIFGYAVVIYKIVSFKKRKIVLVCCLIGIFLFSQIFSLITQYFLEQDFNVVGRRLLEISNIMNGNNGNDEVMHSHLLQQCYRLWILK